ncbi:MAG: hypothetical protein ACI9SZ_001005, partial [Candidatus Thalassarchaeaceae archaeon]
KKTNLIDKYTRNLCSIDVWVTHGGRDIAN